MFRPHIITVEHQIMCFQKVIFLFYFICDVCMYVCVFLGVFFFFSDIFVEVAAVFILVWFSVGTVSQIIVYVLYKKRDLVVDCLILFCLFQCRNCQQGVHSGFLPKHNGFNLWGVKYFVILLQLIGKKKKKRSEEPRLNSSHEIPSRMPSSA
eukprot:TRINITY_DN2842_c0_g2_i1.p3 TRINITY_DN2842_c0_g2~~TRINITY_DN2842_c0_g2_i1.p3  ORF type:complete len:152 (+),score=4.59 TRINITY_DN2842_c0_g2_i1:82-537(+)